MRKDEFLSVMEGIDDTIVEKFAIKGSAAQKEKQRCGWYHRAISCGAAAVLLAMLTGIMLLTSLRGFEQSYHAADQPTVLQDQSQEEQRSALMEYAAFLGIDMEQAVSEKWPPHVELHWENEVQQEENAVQACKLRSADGTELTALISVALPQVDGRISRIEIEDLDRQFVLQKVQYGLYSKEASAKQWRMEREIIPTAASEYLLEIQGDELVSAKGESQLLLRVCVEATNRGLSLDDYQLRIYISESFGRKIGRLLLLAGAAAALLGVFWFWNRYLKLRLAEKTGRRVTRYFFGREIEYGARVISIENTDLFNPAQYLTRNGVVNPGSSGRHHVNFALADETVLQLSVSAKQAGIFEPGMKGTLVHRRSILLSFTPERK